MFARVIVDFSIFLLLPDTACIALNTGHARSLFAPFTYCQFNMTLNKLHFIYGLYTIAHNDKRKLYRFLNAFATATNCGPVHPFIFLEMSVEHLWRET